MATYTWVRGGGTPLRRRPRTGEADAWKRCNGCLTVNSKRARVCRRCTEALQLRRAKRKKLDVDAQLKRADLMIADWHRRARLALGRISKWTKVRNRLMRKQVEEARAAANQDRAPLSRPARRALRVREGSA
jgi:hypothetical protein